MFDRNKWRIFKEYISLIFMFKLNIVCNCNVIIFLEKWKFYIFVVYESDIGEKI